jgi:protein-S-isoprenylcysteine O-methyltransferase Ste14
MWLGQRFAKEGKWLFRWRSFLPLLLVLIIIPAFMTVGGRASDNSGVGFDDLWLVVCIGVSFIGFLIRAYTIGYAPGGTSGRNTKGQRADTLNTTGAYSLVRNPLYLGNFLITLGVSMYPRVWWLVLIYVLLFWLFYERIIYLEEGFLREKFGKTWESWAARTPAIVPKLKGFRRPFLPFSIRNVLSKENHVFINIVLAYAFLVMLRGLLSERKFELDLPWVIVLCTALVVWGVLRILKKSTRVLDVEGR